MKEMVGVDGGGTYTRALAVTPDGQIVGEGRSGPSNHQTVGIEGAVDAVRQAVFAATGGKAPDAVGACLAGVDMPWQADLLRGHLAEALDCRVHVENDIVAALWAVPGRSVGVVASGTGAAVGLRKNGEVRRILALNDCTGPQGGAGDIATLAVREAILAAQGAAPPTRMLDGLLELFALPDYMALAQATEEATLPSWQVTLVVAPLCGQLAAEGDPVARSVLRRMGSELGRTAGRYFTSQGLPAGAPVALYGSLLRGGPSAYREAFLRTMRRYFAAGAEPRDGLDAVQGAVLFAADREGADTDRLRIGLRGFGA